MKQEFVEAAIGILIDWTDICSDRKFGRWHRNFSFNLGLCVCVCVGNMNSKFNVS